MVHSRSMPQQHAVEPWQEKSPERPVVDARRMSHQLATVMRPALPGLVEQITSEIRRSIPDYARLTDGASGPAIRTRIVRGTEMFIDLVDDPVNARRRLEETCRQFGREQATAGRSLDNLLSAYHVGARVSWRWIMRLGRSHNLSSQMISRLAEMLFNYVDELSTLSCLGFHEAEAAMHDSGAELRRNLLRLILSQPEPPKAAIADLARTAGWQQPDDVVLIAIRPGTEMLAEPIPLLGPDVLTDLLDPQPHLLVPAPLTRERAIMLAGRFPGARVAIGPTMAFNRATASLRWARQALAMVRQGVIVDGPVIFCADHLTTLWLLAEEELLGQVGLRRLAPLSQFPDRQRRRLASTLSAWLRTNGNVKEIAAGLGVHPQTVRYRMRQLQDALGDELHDPDARFEMEATLRAAELRAPHVEGD